MTQPTQPTDEADQAWPEWTFTRLQSAGSDGRNYACYLVAEAVSDDKGRDYYTGDPVTMAGKLIAQRDEYKAKSEVDHARCEERARAYWQDRLLTPAEMVRRLDAARPSGGMLVYGLLGSDDVYRKVGRKPEHERSLLKGWSDLDLMHYRAMMIDDLQEAEDLLAKRGILYRVTPSGG